MKAERVAIDSNVWIAALLLPAGTARRCVESVLDGDIDVLMSEAVFREPVMRLERPKFDRYRDVESWDLFLSELVELSVWLEDTGAADGTCRDPDDDKFLALAAVGRADALISGDRDLLVLGSHEGIPVLTPLQFLERFQEQR